MNQTEKVRLLYLLSHLSLTKTKMQRYSWNLNILKPLLAVTEQSQQFFVEPCYTCTLVTAGEKSVSGRNVQSYRRANHNSLPQKIVGYRCRNIVQKTLKIVFENIVFSCVALMFELVQKKI